MLVQFQYNRHYRKLSFSIYHNIVAKLRSQYYIYRIIKKPITKICSQFAKFSMIQIPYWTSTTLNAGNKDQTWSTWLVFKRWCLTKTNSGVIIMKYMYIVYRTWTVVFGLNWALANVQYLALIYSKKFEGTLCLQGRSLTLSLWGSKIVIELWAVLKTILILEPSISITNAIEISSSLFVSSIHGIFIRTYNQCSVTTVFS